ncbi:YihY/virulence factor BrkB family protein [Roseibium sediminicola]|uniref:YihY/virulence factor BrkB family protein n=1 Tax=Roseibium sediminicola TaxID=2933272 RepID=A0ABT0GSU7_9HYPH|nr:YihY/virulence factor BrkB family protein [Roseibium sp. CAU 1639]MCK7612509.1 YihY/virulence factor BrkB family protein [Roseibium sp. CAU 1639]
MSARQTVLVIYAVLKDAIGHFARDDGFAMASHVALSGLLAVFPLLIFIASLAAFFGMTGAADTVSELLFDAWPESVASPVVREVQNVLTVRRGDLLTFGAVAALWFSSNGVEALRTALNRAYRQHEHRSFVLLRLQSIALVLFGAGILLAYTFLVVLAPLGLEALTAYMPKVEAFLLSINVARFTLAGSLLVMGLFITHWLLPSGTRRFRDLWPGVLATLVMWIIAGSAFGAYLASFANYVSTYGGLAGIMTALIFLYICALVFILGGELNAAILRQRRYWQRQRDRREMTVPAEATPPSF